MEGGGWWIVDEGIHGGVERDVPTNEMQAERAGEATDEHKNHEIKDIEISSQHPPFLDVVVRRKTPKGDSHLKTVLP